MAKSAKSGEMRTRITVHELTAGEDDDGFQINGWTDVFGGQKVWCKWINPHGTDIYEQMRLNVKELATITMRYTPKINERCRIFKDYTPTGDEAADARYAYDVISIDDVENEHKLLEIKVQRKEKA